MYARRRIMLACLVASLASTGEATGTSPGSNGRIAYFEQDGQGSGGVIRTDDLSDAEPPVSVDADNSGSPVWSPDGTRLAYIGSVPDPGRPGSFHTAIFAMDADGSDRVQVTEPPPGAYHDPIELEECASKKSGYTSTDVAPAWSPDGERIAFVRRFSGEYDHASCAPPPCRTSYLQQPDHNLWTADATGGGEQKLTTEQNAIYGPIAWASTGRMVAKVTTRANCASTGTTLNEIDPGGGRTPLALAGPAFQDFDVSPDGRRVATVAGGTIRVLEPDGSVITTPGALNTTWVRFTPDGNSLMYETCVPMDNGNSRCGIFTRPLDDPEADIRPEDAGGHYLGFPQYLLPSHHPDFTRAQIDVQAQTHPILFLHGFAGSRLACGGDELWPPTPLAIGADLLDMRLASDGAAPHADACAAAPTGILDSFWGLVDIYQSTLDFLEEAAPDRHAIYVWDWRKDPRLQVAALDAEIETLLDGDLQVRQGVRKVVLMGHSMGGLVMRAYVDDAGRADKVSRALTVGTPYWGSPKAVLPLLAGLENPGGAELDRFLPNDAFQQFARNLTGLFYLYPSPSFGPWLSVEGISPTPFDRTALQAYVSSLGGNSGLLAQALDAHANELDGFKRHEIDYRAFVGLGLSTIEQVRVVPGSGSAPNLLGIGWTNGDGTVPARSGTQGPIGTTTPLGDPVPISYVCGVAHVPLPGHPKVTEAVRGFLLDGTFPRKTAAAACPNASLEMVFRGIDLFDGQKRSGRAAATSLGLQTAAEQGRLQLLEIPGEPIAVTDDGTPVSVTVQADAGRVAVTAIDGTGRGTPAFYGPVTGELSLITGADGSLAVLDDGTPVTPRANAEPGDPGTGTEPDPDPDPVDDPGLDTAQPGATASPGAPASAGPGPTPSATPSPPQGALLRSAALTGPRLTPRTGLRLRVDLREAATVSIRVQIRRGQRMRLVGTTTRRGEAGLTTLTVKRLRGRPLRPGRYVARILATANGERSATRMLRFVVRRQLVRP